MRVVRAIRASKCTTSALDPQLSGDAEEPRRRTTRGRARGASVRRKPLGREESGKRGERARTAARVLDRERGVAAEERRDDVFVLLGLARAGGEHHSASRLHGSRPRVPSIVRCLAASAGKSASRSPPPDFRVPANRAEARAGGVEEYADRTRVRRGAREASSRTSGTDSAPRRARVRAGGRCGGAGRRPPRRARRGQPRRPARRSCRPARRRRPARGRLRRRPRQPRRAATPSSCTTNAPSSSGGVPNGWPPTTTRPSGAKAVGAVVTPQSASRCASSSLVTILRLARSVSGAGALLKRAQRFGVGRTRRARATAPPATAGATG